MQNSINIGNILCYKKPSIYVRIDIFMQTIIMFDPNAILSERVLRMSESATIKMAQMARDLRAEGKDIISLSLGEPDFDTPNHIKDAAKTALDNGFTKYTPVPGLTELRAAISRKFKRDNQLDYGINDITVSNGAKQAIANICLALINPGDEVILFSPYWVTYYEIVKMAGGIPVRVKAGIEQDFKVSAAQLENEISHKTQLIIFSNPCNPTGSVYNKDELAAIADVVAKHDQIIVIADEIYEYITFGKPHISLASFVKIKGQVATVNGFSKGFAMTGWRLGYMGGPSWLVKACNKIQGQFTSGANAFAQRAAADALDANMSPTLTMRKEFELRKNLVRDGLKSIPGFKVNDPEGAFYFFPDISSYFGSTYKGLTIKNADDFSEFILKEALVAVVTGSAFGDLDCIRISYATSQDVLTEALRRIKEAVGKLRKSD